VDDTETYDARFAPLVGQILVDASEMPNDCDRLVELAAELPEGTERDAAMIAAESYRAAHKAFIAATAGALAVLEDVARAQPGAEEDFATIDELRDPFPEITSPGGDA
jgi:hypothetical protein